MRSCYLALAALLASATCGCTPPLDDESQAPEAFRDTLHACLVAPDLPGNHWPAGSAKGLCWLALPQEPSLQEIARMLQQPDGVAALDQRYAQILARHYKDSAHREFLFAAYQDFGTPEGRKLAAEWIAKAPKSPYAQLAEGESALAMAHEARGSAYMSDTSQAQVDGMTAQLGIAVPLLQSALTLQPKLSPACVDLMDAARQVSDDDLEQSATKQCMAIDPLSWHVHSEQLLTVDPRWGGSFEQLDAAVAEIAQHVQDSPPLGSLLAKGIARRAYLGHNDDVLASIAAELDRAALTAPDSYYISKAGMAAEASGDHAKALAYVSQSLRFAPDHAAFRLDRGNVYFAMGNTLAATADAQFAAVHADGDCGCDYDDIARLLFNLHLTDDERVMLHKSLQLDRDHQWASTTLCKTYISPLFVPDQARACTLELVTAYPDDPEVLYIRALTLYAARDPAAADVDAHFRQVASSSPFYSMEITQLEDAKAHPRP